MVVAWSYLIKLVLFFTEWHTFKSVTICWEILLIRCFQALDALLDISGMGWCIPNEETNSSSSPNIFPGNGLFEEECTASIQQSPRQVLTLHSHYNLCSYFSVQITCIDILAEISVNLRYIKATKFSTKCFVLQIAWDHRFFTIYTWCS